jgi:hypothetical protein
MIFFCFCLVFAYSFINIQIANIIYLFYFIKNYCIDDHKLGIKYNISFILYCLFAIWVGISTIAYLPEMEHFDFRFIGKYFFTLQYAVLIMPLKLDEKRFEVLIYRFSIILSVMIIALFIYYYVFQREFLLIGMQTRLWAVDYIPGWPNSTSIPLLFGLWISFRNKFSLFGKLLTYIALYLTLSRGAFLGAFMITALYIYIFPYKLRYIKIFKYTVICSIIFCFTFVFIYYESELAETFYFSDRTDVLNYTISFIKQRPFLGFGGNTLDQLYNINTGYDPVLDWQHAHNWLFEMCLRYGVIGVSIYFLYITSVLININNLEKKAMFVILVFLALFQTFMQEFIYLFLLSYLANDSNKLSIKVYRKN